MKSLAIAAVLAFAGFASLASTASAEHFGGYGGYGGYGGGRATCGPNYGYSQFGQWSQGPLRPQLNLSRSSGWNHGHHDHHGRHNHGHVQRRGNNSGFYFGNRDFSLGIRF